MPANSDMQSLIAAQLRQDYPDDYPPSANDVDVVRLGEHEHPNEVSAYQQAYLQHATRISSQGTMGDIASQGDYGPITPDTPGNIATAAGAAMAGANRVAENIPVVGPVLKSAGAAGKSVVDRENQAAEDIGTAGYPIASGIAKALTAISRATIPQNALGAGLTAASALSGPAEAASEALEPAEGVVGGPLATGKAAKNLAAAGKVMSGTPELNLRSALQDPTILDGTETSQDVGDEMNNWASGMGVKTGAEARGVIPEVQASASPRLGTGRPFADKVVQNVPDYQSAAVQRSGRIFTLQDRIQNAQKIAEDGLSSIVRNLPDAGSDVGAFQNSKLSQVPGQSLAPDPNLINRSLAAQAAKQAIPAVADEIRKSSQAEIESLQQEGSKHLQDLLSARSVMSKLRGAPALSNPMEAEDAYLATQKLNSVDDTISKVADSIRPGAADEYQGLVDRYHAAKVRESMSGLLPQNANGSPSVLRAMAGGASLMHGNPLPLVGMSPVAQAQAIRTAAFLRDIGAQAPSAIAGAASGGALEKGLAAGVSNEESQEK